MADRDRKRISLDTQAYSSRLRALLLHAASRSIRLTSFAESGQAEDLQTPPNCDGFGRLHHFHRDCGDTWPANPLPIDPACKSLDLLSTDELLAQVFQSAGCNWRCWYCYVPFEDLTGRRGDFVSVDQMVSWMEEMSPHPSLVDLTGGQPDLTPEWPVWTLRELDRRGIDDVYVWSDDNLSTDYLWRFVSSRARGYLGDHPRYGRACCLKGYDHRSFVFNTKAGSSDFDQQFELLGRLQQTTDIDYYGYVTFTTPSIAGLERSMRSFVDRLQSISEALPLRTVPLRILEWGPVTERLDPVRRESMELQKRVLEVWLAELDRRFASHELTLPITGVPR